MEDSDLAFPCLLRGESSLVYGFVKYLEDYIQGEVILGVNNLLVNLIDEDGRLKIALEVGEETTHDELREFLPLLIMYRDMLIEWQGYWSRRDSFLAVVSEKNREGASYAILAEMVNRVLAGKLRDYVGFLELRALKRKEWELLTLDFESDDIDVLVDNFKVLMEYHPYTSDTYYPPSVLDFNWLLDTVFAISREQVDEIRNEALNRIRDNKPPFEDGYPISSQKLRNTLRYWRRSRSDAKRSLDRSEADP